MTVGEALMMRPDFDKPAGVRCPHQRGGKGCGIYADEAVLLPNVELPVARQ